MEIDGNLLYCAKYIRKAEARCCAAGGCGVTVAATKSVCTVPSLPGNICTSQARETAIEYTTAPIILEWRYRERLNEVESTSRYITPLHYPRQFGQSTTSAARKYLLHTAYILW